MRDVERGGMRVGARVGVAREAGGRVGAVARHQLLMLRREPGPLIVYTAMAVVLTVFTERMVAQLPGGSTPPASRAAAAMLVFGSTFMTGVVGAAAVDDRAWHTAERLRSVPVRPWELLVGRSLPLVAALAAQQAVVLGTASLLYRTDLPAHWTRLIAVGAAWTVCVLGLGSLMSALVRTHAQLGTVKDLTSLVLSGTGGAVVPLTALPTWLTPLAPFSPAYWAVNGFLGERGVATGTAMTVLAATGGLSLVAAAVLLPRRRPTPA